MINLLCAIFAGTITVTSVSPLLAQDYPVRPITIVVPFAAGGPSDVIVRILTETHDPVAWPANDRRKYRWGWRHDGYHARAESGT